jgi:hypothetical protein
MLESFSLGKDGKTSILSAALLGDLNHAFSVIGHLTLN